MPAVRRFVGYALIACVLSVVVAGVAFGATPTVIDPSTGASAWSYSDLRDASEKREGGYLEFNHAAGGYAPDGSAYSLGSGSVDQSDYVGRGPHGGYDTSTNKCKVCHASHRAEGSYYLTRASSQDDACIYCHGASSSLSSTLVYTGDSGGIHAENGHTIGAGAMIPASSIDMEVEEIELIEGRPDTAVQVRRFRPENKRLYRVVRSHGAAGTPSISGPGGYTRIGPTSLSCSSCHHVHGASAQIWRPTAYDSSYETDANGFLTSGYKLLRRFPGATAVGDPAPGTLIDPADLAKVPESRLTPDVNFSTSASLETTYTENGETFRQPDWVIQEIAGGAGGSAAVVNQFTLSVWCADCHNLAIGGGSDGSNEDTASADPHSDSAHPIPGPAVAGSSAGGGAQCYTCHRGDLARGTGCSQCHYTAAKYRLDAPSSDFPHSGSGESVKLLGAFSIEVSPDAQRWSDFTYVDTTVTAENLDAVCLRCHAVKHADYGSGMLSHDVPAQYAECADCHGTSAAEIHDATASGCDACHAAAVLTFDCGTCHPAQLEPHSHLANYSLMTSQVNELYTCDPCHSNNDLSTLHGTQCASCHPSPRSSFAEWNLTCSQAGCHPTVHAGFNHQTEGIDDHGGGYGNDCWSCHNKIWGGGWDYDSFNLCARCHVTDTTPPLTNSNAVASYIGGATIQLTAADVDVPYYSLVHGLRSTFYTLDGGPIQIGTSIYVPPPLSGTRVHTIQFWSLDNLGNTESRQSAMFTVAADTIPPVTTSNAQASYIGPATITLTATDAHSTVAHTYYRLDGAPQQEGTTVNVPAPPVGEVSTHTLEFWSVDSVGNVESPNTVTFTISSPTATLRLIWTGSDNPSFGSYNESVYYEVRNSTNGQLIASGYDAVPLWDGISTIYNVPVQAAPYNVYVYWNDIFDGGEIFGSVYVTIPGGVVDWYY